MKITRFVLLLAGFLVFTACSSYDGTRVAIKMTGKGNVFEVMENGDTTIPKGDSDLLITFALKTHREDPYVTKTMPTRHDDFTYPVVVNIDGQGAQWPTQCEPDKQERYVKGKHNPEGGEGFKCSLVRRLRLKSGDHVLYVALPEDKFEREVRITFLDGEVNKMELGPVYRRDRPFGPDFVRGIENLDLLLNGQMIESLMRPERR